MRSKSVDNFFQRSNGESRPPSALITTPPPPPSPPPFSESPLAYERSPSHSPSVSPNPSLTSHSPSVSPSLSVTSKNQPKSQAQPVQPVKTHCFQEHVFRRPTSCQRCKHMIQGRCQLLQKQKECSHVGQVCVNLTRVSEVHHTLWFLLIVSGCFVTFITPIKDINVPKGERLY